MRNFTSIFKRCVCAVTAGILALSLAGCSKGDSSSGSGTIGDNSNDGVKVEGIKNLDFINAVISEHTPNSEEWYTLKLRRVSMSPDIVDCMKEIADALGFSDFNERNILCNVSNGDNDPNSPLIPIDEMTEDDYEKLLDACCASNDFYLSLWGNNMINFNNRKVIREAVGDSERLSGTHEWRSVGEFIKSYDVSDEEGLKDKYTLNGKEVSILDVMENAKKFMNEEQLGPNNSDIFRYEPYEEIDIYKETDTNYVYRFAFQAYFDGVPIDASSASYLPESRNSLMTMFNYVYMLDLDGVAFYWTSPLYCSKLVSKEPCEIKVGFDEAAAIVSEKLSQEHVFTVERAELMYCVDDIDPTAKSSETRHAAIKPMWQFTITNTGMQYETLLVYVDAVSGEMSVLWGE